jgi:hypothetical protein
MSLYVRLEWTLAIAFALHVGCARGDSSDVPLPQTDAAPPPTEDAAPDPPQDDASPVPDDASLADSTLDDGPSREIDATPLDEDATIDASDDAGDTSISPANGVACGSSAMRCTGSTQCCATGDAGPAAYACVASGACHGYMIGCAAAADCPSAHSCCHYASGMKCEPSCPIANVVCDPSVVGSCTSGHTCSVPVMVGGGSSPYVTCSP